MESLLRKGTPKPPGQGTSKAARRRRRLKQEMKTAVVKTAPVKSNAKTRRNRNAIGQIRQGFVHCVIDPFRHSGPLTGVPDRFSGLSLITENRTIKTFAPKEYNYFLIIPSFGTNLIYRGSSTELASFTGGDISQWADVDPVLGGDSVDLICEKYRTISLAVRIRYTGVQVVSSGVFRVARLNLVADEGIYFAGTKPNVNRVKQIGEMDLTETSIMSLPDAVTLGVQQGVYATAVRNSSDTWGFTECQDGSFAWTTDDVHAKEGKDLKITSFATQEIDDEWTAILVRYDCYAVNNQYLGKPQLEVEVRHCVEWVPALTSTAKALRTLARQSPKHDQAALNQVSNIQRELPSAIPFDGNWFNRAAKFAGGLAGNFISGMASPMVQAVTGALSVMGLGGNNVPALT